MVGKGENRNEKDKKVMAKFYWIGNSGRRQELNRERYGRNSGRMKLENQRVGYNSGIKRG